MKFIDDPDVERLNARLHFDLPECRISGRLEVFTTKALGTDKKLLKALDRHLINLSHEDVIESGEGSPPKDQEPTHSGYFAESITRYSESVSPPKVTFFSPPTSSKSFQPPGPKSSAADSPDTDKKKRAFSWNSNSTPFGPLDQPASRKVYAYVISVLNALHPDHDFSLLTPLDFKKERSSAHVINTFNNMLFSLGFSLPPKMWDTVDKQIDIKDSTIYSFVPPSAFLADQPGTLWSTMWFFFNKKKRRVAYLHLKARRSHMSPVLRSRAGRGSDSETFDADITDISDAVDDNNDDYDSALSSGESAVVGDLELE